MRVGVALGSNLGDRLSHLRSAQEKIARLPGVKEPFLMSAIYETNAVACESGAGDFLNAVIEFEYEGAPAALLPQLRAIEIELGRPAQHGRNLSRVVDADILYAGDMESSDPALQLPHPRMKDRRFVLEPLADIRPDLVLPGMQKSVGEMLDSLPPSGKVVRLTNDGRSR